jgi:transposase
LDAGQLNQLKRLLKKEAKANGFPTDGWTQKRVQQLIKKEFKVQYSTAHISDLLARLDFTLQVPRLTDIRQDDQERKKYQDQTLPQLKKNS